MDSGGLYNPRTVEEVFRDFKGRRAGMIKALTTDVEEFYQQCDPDLPSVEKRFQQVYVTEPSIVDTVNILRGLKERLERGHGVRILDRALVVAAQLSSRHYITGSHLQDRAIDLVDETCANVRILVDSQTKEIHNLGEKKMQLEVELHALGKEKDNANKARLVKVRKELDDVRDKLEPLMMMKDRNKKERIDKIRRLKQAKDELEVNFTALEDEKPYYLDTAADLRHVTIQDLESAIQELEGNTDENTETVGPKQVAEVVSHWTGIPVARLMQEDNERLIGLADRLQQRVVGQDQAVHSVAEAVITSRAEVGRPEQPTGSFLFLGPSGVGKRELAKALAEQLFDDENHLVRLDMLDYIKQHSVSYLIGAPPGYAVHEEGGQLTEPVKRRPYCVVLFDKVEKAHVSVFNTLLQVLDDGRLTDDLGCTVDFRNTVIIMTSNLGAEHLLTGNSSMQARDKVMEEVKRYFRPELLNRLSKIVVFDPLSHEQLKKVARLHMKDLASSLAERGITMTVTEAALDYSVSESYDPVYGARPVKRWLEEKVKTELTMMLLKEEIVGNSIVYIDVAPAGSELIYRVEKNGGSANNSV